MKTLKQSLFALMTATGILGPIVPKIIASPTLIFNSFYYCKTTGTGGFSWTTVKPAPPFTCQTGSCYCTVDVVTGYTPMDNHIVPAIDIAPGTTPISGVYK